MAVAPDYKPPTSSEELLERYARGERRFDGAMLKNASLTMDCLAGASFADADLRNAVLNGAILCGLNLSRARLDSAQLSGVDLADAVLAEADLAWADLRGANLRGAALTAAHLASTDFGGARLAGADLTGAQLSETVFADVDLSETKGLEALQHRGPSVVDQRTLELSSDLPLAFLRGVGCPDWLIQSYRGYGKGIKSLQFYSCFISHSSKDDDFAVRLHADLQNSGVRCWFAPEDLKTGDVLEDTITGAIRLHEKLVIVLSVHSVGSAWVKREVQTAQARERKEGRPVLFPIRLDDAIKASTEAWASYLWDQRHITDFTGWKDHDAYKKAFERILRDLKADPPRQSSPPPSPGTSASSGG